MVGRVPVMSFTTYVLLLLVFLLLYPEVIFPSPCIQLLVASQSILDSFTALSSLPEVLWFIHSPLFMFFFSSLMNLLGLSITILSPWVRAKEDRLSLYLTSLVVFG